MDLQQTFPKKGDALFVEKILEAAWMYVYSASSTRVPREGGGGVCQVK